MRKDFSVMHTCVSIVIPSYGRPSKLKTCLANLRLQIFAEPWDIVIIDDGSPLPVTKNSLGIDDQSDSLFPQVQIIRQHNAGPAAARNRGVIAAKGELIAFLDDDCIPDPHWLFQLVSSWRLRPGALVGGSTINGLSKEVFASASQTIVSLVYEYFNTDPDSAYFLASNNILCLKRQFQQIGGFAEDFPRAGAEDRDFCDRWRMMQWPITWNKQALIKHYHHQSLTKFIELHIRYGRGAYIYQKMRKQRGSGSIRQDLGFHQSFPRLLVGHSRREQWSKLQVAKTMLPLFIWQLANALGFAIEWIASKSSATQAKGIRV